MPFTSHDDLINQVTVNGKTDDRSIHKRAVTAQGNAVWQRTWNLVGTPGAGAEPAATPGTVYSNTAGGINFANVALPATKHLLVWGAHATEYTTVIASLVGRVTWALQDRLVGVGAISIATTGAKTVNTQALPRYTTGEGLDVWVEVTTTVTGGGIPQLHLSKYTNTLDTPNRVGAIVTLPTNPIAGSIYKLPLQDGDLGVKSVEELTVDVLGTAGVVNVIITKQIGAPNQGMPFTYVPRSMGMQIESYPQLFNGATLELRYMAAGTTAFDIYGGAVMAYGG